MKKRHETEQNEILWKVILATYYAMNKIDLKLIYFWFEIKHMTESFL